MELCNFVNNVLKKDTMINLADKLTAKTVEGILADSNEIKYTKEMGDTAKAETVAKELSNMTDSMSGLSNSVNTLSQEFETAQSDIEQLLKKAEQYTDRFVDNPIADSENAGLMSTADKTKLDSYPSQFVLDLGLVESQTVGEQMAARSEVAGNRNISFIRFQVNGNRAKKTTLIMQWPNGSNETAQLAFVDKEQFRRNVTGATGVKGATTRAYKWERIAPQRIVYNASNRKIRLEDYERLLVSEVELPLATSSQPGLLSADDKTKLDIYPETPLNISTATNDSPGLMSASAHKDLYDTKTIAAGNQTKITDLEAKINEIGNFDTQHQLLARAAEFDIVSNNSIVFIHGTYKQAEGIYHGVFILQQVEMNNNGGGTSMQYIYIEKRQYTRYISFSPTEVTEVQQVQNHGVRNLSLSGRNLQMTDMWGYNIGSGVTFPDNGNIYEGTPSTSSVPVVLVKTFGGTVTTTLSAATSTRAGMMTAEDKTKLDNYPETPLEISIATDDSQGLMSAAAHKDLYDTKTLSTDNQTKITDLETKYNEQEQRIGVLESYHAPSDMVEMTIQNDKAQRNVLFFKIEWIDDLEIDGRPINTEGLSGKFYRSLSVGEHNVRFRVSEDNRKQRGLLGWADDDEAGYVSNVTRIVIPEGWTELPSNCFERRLRLEEIVLPSTLETVGGNCFQSLPTLRELIIPKSVTTIQWSAINDCKLLKCIHMGGDESSPLSLSYEAIRNCPALTCVEFLPCKLTFKDKTPNSNISPFQNLPQLNALICHMTEPPTFEPSTPFGTIGSGTTERKTLYRPAGVSFYDEGAWLNNLRNGLRFYVADL